ncbi:DUF6392 family protein [Photorhabdus hindustanensis]|uniref:Pyocin immunity protein n=1 Tax=Photorhabdus hindustanensis TaxID=2918802 RepID=A0A2S8Q3S9_9GAMM|nr:DUF6392 family protein [Photorhabdus hindustanensis]PQQ26832.1 pyocin immunity protein [Photorhabdus hindustanensis]
MTVNIDALINSLGKSYQEIFDEGLIPYKTKPTGYPGDPNISLHMIKEGVHLAFRRNGKILFAIGLILIDEKKDSYQFPNELPPRLIPIMSRQWIHEQFGEPERSLPPRRRLTKEIGWTELYTLLDSRIPTSMQVDYDLLERVRLVTFLPTSVVRW